MAKIVPVVQLAVHAKSSTLYGRAAVRLYGRTVVQPNFSAWWVTITTILYIYGTTLCELRYKKVIDRIFAFTNNKGDCGLFSINKVDKT